MADTPRFASGRVLVVAFEGWNDAGEAASGAVRVLRDSLELDADRRGRPRGLLRLPVQPADGRARRRRQPPADLAERHDLRPRGRERRVGARDARHRAIPRLEALHERDPRRGRGPGHRRDRVPRRDARRRAALPPDLGVRQQRERRGAQASSTSSAARTRGLSASCRCSAMPRRGPASRPSRSGRPCRITCTTRRARRQPSRSSRSSRRSSTW